MAEFTDQEKELLDKLRKGFERDAKTRSQLEPWQELIDRDETVNANRASAAAKIIEGFAGSWAAQYNFGRGSSITPTSSLVSEAVADVDPQGPPIPVRAKTSKLGLRGPPEINFVPYNWRTNTFANKGPSLVGHPIGFQVVGPTLKSPVMNWTWQVLEGAGPNGGDLLRMSLRANGLGNVMEPYAGDISLAYGPFAPGGMVIGGASEPNGGLYVLITDDGLNPGSLPVGRVPMTALDRFADSSRFELFRVASLPAVGIGVPYEIEIHPDKRLSTYFDLPAASVNRSIRAITLVRPYVTRLAAIPQSGAVGGNDGVSVSGREQAFVVVSPELAATGEHFPPFEGPLVGDGTWIQGGFTGARSPGTTTPGEPSAYGGASRLPIPIPVQEVTASVETSFGAPTTLVGQWALEVPMLGPYTTGLFASRFPIVNITVTQRDDTLPTLSLGSIPSCLGWFDAVGTGVGPDRLFLNRVPETDPQTGLTYWGPGPYINNTFGVRDTGILAMLHEPIEALWEGEFNLDGVEASRVKTMIDPQWVGRFEKQIADPLLLGGTAAPPPGSGPGRPDRALFDTRSTAAGGPIPNAANPGSLMDLGFRMVLFPAKEDPNDVTQAIPDFDRPIMGRELVIDGSLSEKQYLDVDYSSGVVRLSHAPPTSSAGTPDNPSDVIPNGIQGISGNNPRGEIVLFAACVPYSMEDSQVGTGVRVTSSEDDNLRDFDIYSAEVSAKIDFVNTTFTVTNPYIGISVLTGDLDIVLDRLWDGPETGVLSILNGSDRGIAFGLWGYETKTTVTLPSGEQVTTLGGITAKSLSSNPDPSLHLGAQTRLCVLRREVVFRRESFSIPFVTDFVSADTYYGSSTRADTLRFQRSRLEPQLDGSMSVRPLPDLGSQDRARGTLSPSKMRTPIGDPTLVGPSGEYLGEDGILTGLDYQGLTFPPTPGGVYLNTEFGPALSFDTDIGGGLSYHGFITVPGLSVTGDGDGAFRMDDNFRFVAKISTAYLFALQRLKAFIGLVQDEVSPLVTPTVDVVTQGPTGGVEPGLPLRYSVVGFHLDNTASPNWRFWTRGTSGTENVLSTGAVSDSTVSITSDAYYFVIEVPRYGAAASASSGIVKLGVFDHNKNLLDTVNVTHSDLVPTPGGPGLFVCGGSRREAGAPGNPVSLHIHNVSVVLDKDVGTFDLPRLP